MGICISNCWSGAALGLRIWGMGCVGTFPMGVGVGWKCSGGTGTYGPWWLTAGDGGPVLMVITCRESQRGRESQWEKVEKWVKGRTWNMDTDFLQCFLWDSSKIMMAALNELTVWYSNPHDHFVLVIINHKNNNKQSTPTCGGFTRCLGQ